MRFTSIAAHGALLLVAPKFVMGAQEPPNVIRGPIRYAKNPLKHVTRSVRPKNMFLWAIEGRYKSINELINFNGPLTCVSGGEMHPTEKTKFVPYVGSTPPGPVDWDTIWGKDRAFQVRVADDYQYTEEDWANFQVLDKKLPYVAREVLEAAIQQNDLYTPHKTKVRKTKKGPKKDSKGHEWQLVHNPQRSHIKQGDIGDCYLQASLAALTESEAGREILRHSIRRTTDHHYYVIFKWKYEEFAVEVRDALAIHEEFGDVPRWPFLIREAYKIVMGDKYENIHAGYMSLAMSLLTGRPVDSHRFQRTDTFTAETIRDPAGDNWPIIVFSLTDVEPGEVHTCHAYSVVATDDDDNIILFNPHNEPFDDEGQCNLGGEATSLSNGGAPENGLIKVQASGMKEVQWSITDVSCAYAKNAAHLIEFGDSFGDGEVIEIVNTTNKTCKVDIEFFRNFLTAANRRKQSVGMAIKTEEPGVTDYKMMFFTEGFIINDCPIGLMKDQLIPPGTTYLKPVRVGSEIDRYDVDIGIRYNESDLKNLKFSKISGTRVAVEYNDGKSEFEGVAHQLKEVTITNYPTHQDAHQEIKPETSERWSSKVTDGGHWTRSDDVVTMNRRGYVKLNSLPTDKNPFPDCLEEYASVIEMTLKRPFDLVIQDPSNDKKEGRKDINGITYAHRIQMLVPKKYRITDQIEDTICRCPVKFAASAPGRGARLARCIRQTHAGQPSPHLDVPVPGLPAICRKCMLKRRRAKRRQRATCSADMRHKMNYFESLSKRKSG